MLYAALLLPLKLLFPDGYWKINTQISSLVCHTLMFPYPFFSFTTSTAVLPFPVRSTLFSLTPRFSSLFHPIFILLLLGYLYEFLKAPQIRQSFLLMQFLLIIGRYFIFTFYSTSELLRDKKFLFFSSTVSVHERRLIYICKMIL